MLHGVARVVGELVMVHVHGLLLVTNTAMMRSLMRKVSNAGDGVMNLATATPRLLSLSLFYF